MCKVLMIAGIKEDNTQLAWSFLEEARPYMSAHDKDGIGYAALGRTSGLFGERWLNPEDAFVCRPATTMDVEVKDKLKDAISEIPTIPYTLTGDWDEDICAVIYHSRHATCAKTLTNVHPFFDGKTALIHNGVINNDHAKGFKKKTSTCDSEVILHAYLDEKVNKSPDNIEDLTVRLQGYYACGVLTEDKEGNKILDIFKSSLASLFVTYIDDLETEVYCTSKEILEKTCKDLGFTYHHMFTIKEGNLIRIDAVTGKVISIHAFKGDRGWSHTGSGFPNGYPENMRKYYDEDDGVDDDTGNTTGANTHGRSRLGDNVRHLITSSKHENRGVTNNAGTKSEADWQGLAGADQNVDYKNPLEWLEADVVDISYFDSDDFNSWMESERQMNVEFKRAMSEA